jgi:hypothetical protein
MKHDGMGLSGRFYLFTRVLLLTLYLCYCSSALIRDSLVSGQHHVVHLCCLCHWWKYARIRHFHNLIIPTHIYTYSSTESNSDVHRIASGSHVTLQSHVIGLPIKLAFNLICSSRMPAKLCATARCLMVLYRMLKRDREWKCCVACRILISIL